MRPVSPSTSLSGFDRLVFVSLSLSVTQSVSALFSYSPRSIFTINFLICGLANTETYILIHNHSTYMFYFYIFYLTYSVLHGAIRRLVYDTRFAFYAVALNYVLALFLFFYLYVCLGVLLIVYLFIIFYALIKSGKIAIQIWQVVADKCAQIFVKLARCRKNQMANPTMPPLGSSCCRSVITGLMVVVS